MTTRPAAATGTSPFVWETDLRLPNNGAHYIGTSRAPTILPRITRPDGRYSVLHEGQDNSGHMWSFGFFVNGREFGATEDAEVKGVSGQDVLMSGRVAVADDIGNFCAFEGYGADGWIHYLYDSTFVEPTELPRASWSHGTSGAPALVKPPGSEFAIMSQERGGTGRFAVGWMQSSDHFTTRAQAIVSGITLTGSPAAAMFEGQIYMVHEQKGGTGFLSYATYDPVAKLWSNDKPIIDRNKAPYRTTGSPSVIAIMSALGEFLYVFSEDRGETGNLLIGRFNAATRTWDPQVMAVDKFGRPLSTRFGPDLKIIDNVLVCMRESRRDLGKAYATTAVIV